MGIAHRKFIPQRAVPITVGVTVASSPVIPDILYRESRFAVLPDGSPITNVGDDGEGMEHSYNLPGCQAWVFGTSASKSRIFMYSEWQSLRGRNMFSV